MAPALSRELIAVLTSPQTTLSQAADAIEEHVMFRRAKGDTLLGVSSGLHSMETRSPRLAPAIRQAQYVTNIPPSSDLNNPPGSLGGGSLASSSTTPSAVLNYLLSTPTPSILNSRKVILEYVLAREARLREKKHGLGGKGTLGRDSFEDIAARLGEIENGLRGTGSLVGFNAAAVPAVPDEELDDPRKTGLALILSLRMLLSYFTLPDLARQLLCQHPSDAERTLVQHVRRRVPGEGRYNVGRELEFVESLTLNRRPALRPAFRSARARTYLPARAVYQIPLPAPSKSACIKLLSAFIRDVEVAGPTAAQSYMHSPPLSHTFSATGATPKETNSSGFRSRKGAMGSPASSHSSSPGSPSRASQGLLPHDPAPVESYALELISEFLTREKRDYMLKNKWVKMGRDQLGKDLADIEMSLCVIGKSYPGPNAPSLMPVFLQVRRTFALPASPLPAKVLEPFYGMLPSQPDPDSIPLREPSVSSTTASLYVNPRLPDVEALDLIEELLENEREKGINADVSQEKTIAWLDGLVDQMVKRFPDGSYETVFDQARYLAAHPRVWPDAANSSAFPEHPLVSKGSGSDLGHRRSKSSAIPSPPDKQSLPRFSQGSQSSGGRHKRSVSMPMSSTYSDEDSRQSTRLSSAGSETSYNYWVPPEAQTSAPSHPQSLAQDEERFCEEPSDRMSDIPPVPEMPRDLNGLGLTGFSASSAANRNKAPPLLSLVVPGPELSIDIGQSLNTPSPGKPPSGGAQSTGSSGKGGWWDLISPIEHSPSGQMPWDRRRSSQARSPLSPTGSGGQDLFQGRESTLSSQSIQSTLEPPPPLGAHDEAAATDTSPKSSQQAEPMTPQMEARIAQLMNPSMDVDSTPKAPPTSEMPRPQVPPMSAAAQEALARLEGVHLHDEALAKLEGTHNKPLPLVESTALPQPSVPSKAAQQQAQQQPPKPPPVKETPPPAPPRRPTTPEDDLYARLDFIPMDYNPMHKPAARPAGPIWPNKASDSGVARSNTQRSPPTQKSNGGAPVWPRRKPSDTQVLPPLSTVNEFASSEAPQSAPLQGSDSAWHGASDDGHGTLQRSATQSKRPPPVPTSMNRPGFPTPGSGPRKSHDGQRDSGGETTKSKFGAFIGRNMARREKENTSERPAAAPPSSSSSAALSHQQSQRRRQQQIPVANNPGRWNRDMVAGIMGPPAERRQV